MSDMTRIVEGIKKAAVDAVDAARPTSVCFGTVQTVSPLKIITEQKLPLGPAQLVLTRHVTDYTIDMTVDHLTEKETCSEPHEHGYVGRKQFLVHGALQEGDKVVLLQEQGGQRYIVWDRVVGI